MSGNDQTKATGAVQAVCEDGLCRVGRPAVLPLSVRKLGITADREGAVVPSVVDNATAGGSTTPTRRPFLVDLLHGNVDLERFFKD